MTTPRIASIAFLVGACLGFAGSILNGDFASDFWHLTIRGILSGFILLFAMIFIAIIPHILAWYVEGLNKFKSAIHYKGSLAAWSLVTVLLGVFLSLLTGCSRGEPTAKGPKVVPNDPPAHTKVLTDRMEPASNADLENLTVRESQKFKERVASREDKVIVNKVPNLLAATPDEKETAYSDYKERLNRKRANFINLNSETKPAQESQAKTDLRPPPRRKDSLFEQKPAKPPKQKQQQQARSGGVRPYLIEEPQSQGQNLQELIPPGELFRARLISNLEVGIYSPLALATVSDAAGRVIGTAIGQASLNRGLKDRAIIGFREIRIASPTGESKAITGNLIALDLDLAEGVTGTVDRQSISKLLLAFLETALATFALELDGSSSGFAAVFRTNLANSLLTQARGRIEEAQLDRVIRIPRGTAFWITSRQSVTSIDQQVSANLDVLTTSARNAISKTLQTQEVPSTKQQAINRAYERLEQKLRRGQ